MPYYLRKISLAKWQCKKELGNDAISADAITCDLKTLDNKLSFWQCNDVGNEKEFNETLLAIVGTLERVDKVDVAWIEDKDFAEKEIGFDESPGKSMFNDLNNKHSDAINLELRKITNLAGMFVNAARGDNARNCRRLSPNEVKALFEKAIAESRIEYIHLPEKIKERLAQEPKDKGS